MTRTLALALMNAELLRDPAGLAPNGPPAWLCDLAEAHHENAARSDSRLDALATRVVDDLLAEGVTAGQLIAWLEARHHLPTPREHVHEPPRTAGDRSHRRSWNAIVRHGRND
jgi:hypothetical protein